LMGQDGVPALPIPIGRKKPTNLRLTLSISLWSLLQGNADKSDKSVHAFGSTDSNRRKKKSIKASRINAITEATIKTVQLLKHTARVAANTPRHNEPIISGVLFLTRETAPHPGQRYWPKPLRVQAFKNEIELV